MIFASGKFGDSHLENGIYKYLRVIQIINLIAYKIQKIFESLIVKLNQDFEPGLGTIIRSNFAKT